GLAQAMSAARAEEDAQGVEYRLLTLHTGVEGEVPRMQGLPSRASFQPLKAYVDYLALGHVHKPYEYEGWIYNPGSTETCGAEESAWEDRGYYVVEIDTDEPARVIDPDKAARCHRATHLVSKRRPFVRHELRVDGLSEPDALYEHLEHYCRREGLKYQSEMLSPVIQIHLVGTLAFDAGSLDQKYMEEIIVTHFQP